MEKYNKTVIIHSGYGGQARETLLGYASCVAMFIVTNIRLGLNPL